MYGAPFRDGLDEVQLQQEWSPCHGGDGKPKDDVLPWEASDRREMLIVGAVDADGHKAAAYFVELYADGKPSLGEWFSSVQVDNWVAQLLGAEARTVQ